MSASAHERNSSIEIGLFAPHLDLDSLRNTLQDSRFLLRVMEQQDVVYPLALPGKTQLILMSERALMRHQERWAKSAVPLIVLVSADYALHAQCVTESILITAVHAVLCEPLNALDLVASIELAIVRHTEAQKLSQELTQVQQQLAERKVIERAKGLMMKHLGIDESEAFRRLQRLSTTKNQKLIDIAHMIVTAAEALTK